MKNTYTQAPRSRLSSAPAGRRPTKDILVNPLSQSENRLNQSPESEPLSGVASALLANLATRMSSNPVDNWNKIIAQARNTGQLNSDLENRINAIQAIAILIMTANPDVVDKLLDFKTEPAPAPRGAVKPRLIDRTSKEQIVIEDLALDLSRQEVFVGETRINLTKIEFKLLKQLVIGRGEVQPRERLLDVVWGYSAAITTRTVDTHILRLRRKLGEGGRFINTVIGFGYRFDERSQQA